MSCTGQLAFAFPNHLSFVRTQKWIWGPSILLGFWDHPPRTTAWGKPVKVTHRPSAPHSRAPSWTTGHHWVPPAVERLARKVGPKVLAPWSLFGPKEPNAPRAVPLFHTKCGGPGWQTPTPTGALSVPIVGETHLGQAGIWGQSWHSTGYWVERLWKAEESSGSMGSIELQRAEAL